MKFGKKLDKLSVPEWKAYNLDYNELKCQIRLLTTPKDNASISSKESVTTESNVPRNTHSVNTDYVLSVDEFATNVKDQIQNVNLFTSMKRNELQRNLTVIQNNFSRALNSNRLSEKIKLKYFNNIIIISEEVKNLSKFIVIQKIALTKLFKKFNKYYTTKAEENTENGERFAQSVNGYLSREPNSFSIVDLTPLILEITFLLEILKDTNLAKNDTERTQILTKVGNSQSQLKSNIDRTNWNNSTFDLNSFAKSYFEVNYLLDSQNLNQLKLNLSIDFKVINDDIQSLKTRSFLNLKKTGSLTRVPQQNSIGYPQDNSFDIIEKNSYCSILYLSNQYSQVPPSVIITQSDKEESIIISEVGGLRRFAHCTLSNESISLFLSLLKKNKELNVYSKEEHEKKLNEFINRYSGLTKMTLTWIQSKNLTPMFKRIFKRFRYLLTSEEHDNRSEMNGNRASSSNTSPGVNEQDYYLCLDTNIYTTDKDLGLSFAEFFQPSDDSNLFDKFPYDNLSINYNNQILELPEKISNLIESNKLNLKYFENLNWFHYFNSIYLNINLDSFNNIRNIKNLNLLKANEILLTQNVGNSKNVQRNNMLVNQRNPLINSNDNHQSYGSITNGNHLKRGNSSTESKNSSKDSTNSTTIAGYWNEFDNDYDNIYNSNQNHVLYANDGYNHSYYDSSFINTLINLLDRFVYKKKKLSKKRLKILSESEVFQKYQDDYDKTVSLLYFSSFFLSIVLLGILCGIIYSILEINPDHLMTDNAILTFMVIGLLILTLVLNLTSLGLMLSRFSFAPVWQYLVIWSGFGVVLVSVVWCILLILE